MQSEREVLQRPVLYPLCEQTGYQKPRKRQHSEAQVHRRVDPLGQIAMGEGDRFSGAHESLEPSHVGVPNHHNTKEDCSEGDLEGQQRGVLELLQLIDLLENPICVKDDEAPVESLPENRMLPGPPCLFHGSSR